MKTTLVMAVTADGMIARNSTEVIDWTGKADKRYFVSVTKKAGVMIMGSKTFDMIGQVLPGRKSIVITKDPSRISDHPDLMYTDQAPEQILSGLAAEGYTGATVIGGSIVNTLFMKKGLIDEIHLTVVPLLFGDGLSLFNQELDIKLALMEAEPLEKDCLLLKYKVEP